MEGFESRAAQKKKVIYRLNSMEGFKDLDS